MINLIKWYYYLYYKLYKFGCIVKTNFPPLNAVGFLSFIECVYFYAFTKYLEIQKIIIIKLDNTEALILFFGLVAINYFLLMHKEKYKKIEEMFKNESKIMSVIGWVIIITFFVGSQVFFFWIV